MPPDNPAQHLEPHRWQAGESGNRLGRPKGAAGLAKAIRDATGDVWKVAEWVLSVFNDPAAPFEHRKWAAEWLTDRAIGKAMQVVDVQSHGERIISMALAATPEELAEFDAKIRARSNLPVIDAESTERPAIVDITPPPLALPK